MDTAVYEALREKFADRCAEWSCVPSMKERRREEALGEFDILCGDTRVLRVGSSGGTFFVATKPLVMVSAGDKIPRALGDFINYFTSSGNILCENLTGIKPFEPPVLKPPAVLFQKCGHHPHVSGDMRPCWGDYADKKRAWVVEGKLAHLAIFTMNFLEVARGNADYASPSCWPRLEGEELARWRRQQQEKKSYESKFPTTIIV